MENDEISKVVYIDIIVTHRYIPVFTCNLYNKTEHMPVSLVYGDSKQTKSFTNSTTAIDKFTEHKK